MEDKLITEVETIEDNNKTEDHTKTTVDKETTIKTWEDNQVCHKHQ
tara:strand:+ start:91 stop:228 length:138 start_codon:yes stop_codon:yes gene_type:complete